MGARKDRDCGRQVLVSGNLDSRISERTTEDSGDRSRQRVCAPPGRIGKGGRGGYDMGRQTGRRPHCRVS